MGNVLDCSYGRKEGEPGADAPVHKPAVSDGARLALVSAPAPSGSGSGSHLTGRERSSFLLSLAGLAPLAPSPVLPVLEWQPIMSSGEADVGPAPRDQAVGGWWCPSLTSSSTATTSYVVMHGGFRDAVSAGDVTDAPHWDTFVLDVEAGRWIRSGEVPVKARAGTPHPHRIVGGVLGSSVVVLGYSLLNLPLVIGLRDGSYVSKATASAVRPKPREGHTVIAVGTDGADALWLYGGRSLMPESTAQPEPTLFELNAQRWKWVAVQPDGPEPPRRTQHAACAAGTTSMAVFGGRELSTGALLADLWLFDGVRWIRLCDGADVAASVGETSSGPSARAGASLAALGPDWLLLCGGCTLDGPCADVWLFDRVERRWHACASPPFSARSNALLAASPDGTSAVLFGGRGADGRVLGDAYRLRIRSN